MVELSIVSTYGRNVESCLLSEVEFIVPCTNWHVRQMQHDDMKWNDRSREGEKINWGSEERSDRTIRYN